MKDTKYETLESLLKLFEEALRLYPPNRDIHGRPINNERWKSIDQLQYKLTPKQLMALSEFMSSNRFCENCDGMIFPNGLYCQVPAKGCDEGGLWDSTLTGYKEKSNGETFFEFEGSTGPCGFMSLGSGNGKGFIGINPAMVDSLEVEVDKYHPELNFTIESACEASLYFCKQLGLIEGET